MQTWTGTYTLTQTDVDAIFLDNQVDNLATATGQDPNGDDVTDDDPADLTITPQASLLLAKDGAYEDVGSDGLNPGDKLNYTFKVTNDGEVTITNVMISETSFDLPGPITITPPADTDLSPGEMQTWTGTYTLTQTDVDAIFLDNQVDNLATATGQDPNGDDVTDDDPADLTITPQASLLLAKDGAYEDVGSDGLNPGDKLNYTFKVTNDGEVTITNVMISETSFDLPGPITITPPADTDLSPGEMQTWTGTYTLTQTDVDAIFLDNQVDNLATATGQDPNGDDVSDDDPADIRLQPVALIEIVKSVVDTDNNGHDWNDINGNDLPDAGETIDYNFKVTNTGNVTLSDVVVTDDMATVANNGALSDDAGDGVGTLKPGDMEIATGQYILTQADINNGQKDNTASVTGDCPDGTVDCVEDEDMISTPLPKNPQYSIIKNITGTKNPDDTDGGGIIDEVGDKIVYQIVVTNDGNVDLTGTSVSDPLLGGLLTPDSGDNTDPGTLNVGEIWTYNEEYEVPLSDFEASGNAEPDNDDANGGISTLPDPDGDIDNVATLSSDELDDQSDEAEQPLDDIFPPGIACPPPITVTCLGDVPDPDISLVTATDNRDPNPVVTHVGDVQSGLCPVIITRTYKAVDNAGNEETCTQEITVESAGAPIETSCPDSLLSLLVDQPQSVIDAEFDAWIDQFGATLGGCNVQVRYEIDGIEVDLDTISAPNACGGSINIMQIAESDCGSDTCQASYTIPFSARAFLLALPGNLMDCHTLPQPPTPDMVPVARTDEMVVAFLSASPCIDLSAISITHNLNPNPTIDGNEYTFTRTYFVEGPNGLSTEGGEKFTFLWDPGSPELLNVPEDMLIPCGSEPPAWPNVTAIDELDGELPVMTSEEIIESVCGKFYYVRTWTATDGCGNTISKTQNIRFEDDEAPVLHVPNDTSIYCGDLVPEPYYEAFDNCSDFELTFEEERIDHNDCEYTLIRTWKAKDGCNNWTTKTQTIDVYDDKAPVIHIVNPMLQDIPLGGEMIMYSCENPQVAMGDVELDDCCAPELETYDRLIAHYTCDVFGYHRKWKCGYIATDGAGNRSEFYFYVLQYDTTAPVLHNVPADTVIACGELVPEVPDSIYGEDDCVLSHTPDFKESIVYDPEDSSKYGVIRTWTFADACDNTVEESQIISVCGFDTTLISSELGNTVWFDSNSNGLQDSSEVGVNNVKVYLYCPDPMKPDTMVLMDSTETGNFGGRPGQFIFDHLVPGQYLLRFEKPEGMAFTSYKQGDDDELDSDANEVTGMSEFIQLDVKTSLTNLDAGLVQLSVLPVQMSEFYGKSEDCINKVVWSTLNELNTDRFDVQRSYDGKKFETIGSVSGAGTTHIPQSYSFDDNKADSAAFYRLKQVDLDGSSSFSNMIHLKLNCGQNSLYFHIYPNPSRKWVSVEYEIKVEQIIHLRLFDHTGKLITVEQKSRSKGIYHEKLDLSKYPKGMYWIQLQTRQEIMNKPIVKLD